MSTWTHPDACNVNFSKSEISSGGFVQSGFSFVDDQTFIVKYFESLTLFNIDTMKPVEGANRLVVEDINELKVSATGKHAVFIEKNKPICISLPSMTKVLQLDDISDTNRCNQIIISHDDALIYVTLSHGINVLYGVIRTYDTMTRTMLREFDTKILDRVTLKLAPCGKNFFLYNISGFTCRWEDANPRDQPIVKYVSVFENVNMFDMAWIGSKKLVLSTSSRFIPNYLLIVCEASDMTKTHHITMKGVCHSIVVTPDYEHFFVCENGRDGQCVTLLSSKTGVKLVSVPCQVFRLCSNMTSNGRHIVIQSFMKMDDDVKGTLTVLNFDVPFAPANAHFDYFQSLMLNDKMKTKLQRHVSVIVAKYMKTSRMIQKK